MLTGRLIPKFGAALAGLAVVMGAFGAHGLREILSPYATEVYQKAVLYQFVHAIALLLVALLLHGQLLDERAARRVAGCFLLGIMLFSGSLFALALSSMRFFGVVTPFGGVLFILGWALLALRIGSPPSAPRQQLVEEPRAQ